MILDMDRRELIDGDKWCRLTPRQADIVELLASGAPASYGSLIGSLWPDDDPINPEGMLKTMVSTIRHRVRIAGVALCVVNRWGFGYRLDSPIEVRRAGVQPIFIRPEHRKTLERLLSTHPDHAAADRVLASFVGA
jgi:DNA-binding winged helix-turn-helix (wHTH) protein